MNILMTGCSRSVGNFIKDRLEDQGHKVFGVGVGGPEFCIDFSNHTLLENSVSDIFYLAENLMGGPINCLINNAAITHLDYLENQEINNFTNVLSVNLVAPFIFSREFVRRIADKNSRYGVNVETPYRIISTTSMGTKTALRCSTGYCASKSGLEAMTKVWAKEFAGRYPIITCAIAPAGIENTAMKDQCVNDLQRTRGMSKLEAINYFNQSPLKRECSYEEVWAMFDFAVNNMPEYCSGEVFYMTGGTGL